MLLPFLQEKRNKSNAWRCSKRALLDDIYEFCSCNLILKVITKKREWKYWQGVGGGKVMRKECIRAYRDNNDEIILMFFSNQVLWCERLFKLDFSHILNTSHFISSLQALQLTSWKSLKLIFTIEKLFPCSHASWLHNHLFLPIEYWLLVSSRKHNQLLCRFSGWELSLLITMTHLCS